MLTLILLGMAIGYLIVAIIIIYFFSKLIKKTVWRWIFRIVLFAVFIFLPVSDQILGRYYFEHLCEKEGGLHVYETVELGPEYYYEDGSPRFMDEKGRFDSSIFNGTYEFEVIGDENISKWIVIDKTTHNLKNTITDKVLGNYIWFIFRGGWINNNFSSHRGGISCELEKGGYYNIFIKHVLKPLSK